MKQTRISIKAVALSAAAAITLGFAGSGPAYAAQPVHGPAVLVTQAAGGAAAGVGNGTAGNPGNTSGTAGADPMSGASGSQSSSAASPMPAMSRKHRSNSHRAQSNNGSSPAPSSPNPGTNMGGMQPVR